MNKMPLFIAFLMIVVLTSPNIEPSNKEYPPKTALLIIDVQNFYFPGGGYPLVNPEAASLNAAKLLKKFRAENRLVIHVRHNAKSGADIHQNVKPLPGEKVISKNSANSFKNTDLLEYLKEHQVTRLVICGMMTHMCVEAAARAASDFGFQCILVHDACATRALKFNNKTISAEDVHYSTLSTLSRTYAKVIDTETFLNLNKKYADVFKPLDGKWKGKFHVYQATSGQQKENPQPKNIDETTIKNLPLKETMVIDVEQTYTSEGPYLQGVVIKDTYTNEDGSKKVVVSKGFNKVEDGILLCIVNKPDEQVIHTGKKEGEKTIIWQRNIKQPLKIEYFKETVDKNKYTIVGWGYYGNDDPKQSPKTWFYSLYFRLK